MFIKWIVCEVKENSHNEFSRAQEKWKSILTAPGLIAQFGGWDSKNENAACILSLWQDRTSYDYFIKEIHDTITNSNSQGKAYSHISVDFFYPKLPMPGKFSSLGTAIPSGKFLRVADCRIKKVRNDHFNSVQQDVWIPEMQKSSGMLGGSFNFGIQDEDHFLVTTLWDSAENHRDYVEKKVPQLRERADVSMDLESIIGRFVHLAPSWLVLPNRE